MPPRQTPCGAYHRYNRIQQRYEVPSQYEHGLSANENENEMQEILARSDPAFCAQYRVRAAP